MSRNPYKKDSKPPVPCISVFAFVDILGYQDLIDTTQGQTEQLELLTKLHNVLSCSRAWLDGGYLPEAVRNFGDKDRFVLKAFTDNIAIGWPIVDDGETEMGLAFNDLAAFQLEMVNAGFFVRGAISVGCVYLDEIVVFGDALKEAYEGESSLARDPRIVLTQSACQYVRQHLEYYLNSHHAPQNRDVLKDTDEQWFLNYLDTILIAESEVGPFLDELQKHKNSVESKLEQFRQKPPIFSKYAWTAGYHNYFCELHDFHAYKINVESFAGDRSYIVDDV